MKFATATDLCALCTDHIMADGTGYYIENPADLFTNDAKDGKYDDMPDVAYNALVSETDELAGLWDNQPRRTVGDILLNILDRSPMDRDQAGRLGVLLAGMLTKPTSGKGGGPQSALGPVLKKSFEVRTPKEIRNFVARHVIGQPEAVKAAALIMWHQLSGRRTNAVFCGPSGCGKSEIWRCLSKEYPGLVRMVDFSRFSADGWSGSLHLRDIFNDIDPAAIRRRGLVVVLDEADKILCEHAIGSGGTDHNAIVQNGLLKLLDGDVVEFGAKDDRPALSIDCSKISVVMLGAFERLLDGKIRDAKHIGFGSGAADAGSHRNITYGDLIRAGMRREIAGRVNKIVILDPLSPEDYRSILEGPVLAGVQGSVKRPLRVDAAAACALAAHATESGLGVRWMRSAILDAMDDALFDAPEAEAYVITLRDGKLRCRARKPRKDANARKDRGCTEDFPF